MVSYNTQIDNTTKKYKIQFETDDYDVFKWVEKICSNTVDTDNLLEVFSTCEARNHRADNQSFCRHP